MQSPRISKNHLKKNSKQKLLEIILTLVLSCNGMSSIFAQPILLSDQDKSNHRLHQDELRLRNQQDAEEMLMGEIQKLPFSNQK
jgi:cell division protein FtsB